MGKLIKFNLFILILFLLIGHSCNSREKSNSDGELSKTPSKSSQLILDDLYSQKDKFQLCEGEIDSSLSQDYSSVYPLNNREYLVEILCFLGAYQGNYQYFLYTVKGQGVEIKPLSFQEFSKDKTDKFKLKDSRSIGGVPSYDEESKILTVYTKGRGLADCGSLAQYKWEDTKFKLLEYRIKEKCDGNYLEPENYPKIYP
jgi:hypothetical protein